ncbi:MAG: DNA gyrase inhibitor YacG [Pseudomonadota bacterium]|nr:DNA gyrase inhibitor YacG [Pseudomonadota bacterium]
MTVAQLPKKKAAKCLACGKPSVQEHRPFCSARCRDVDLGRWLGGVYSVPVEEDERGAPEDKDPEA